MAVGTLAATLNPLAPRPYKGASRSYEQNVVIAITGNYATGGVVVNLMGLNTPGSSPPYRWEIKSGDALGQDYQYDPGADRSLGKILSYAGATEDGDDGSWPDTTLLATFWYNSVGLAEQ